MSLPPYSVLMSVYKKENPEWLASSLDSIFNQSIQPAEIIMIKDGPITMDLNAVLEGFDAEHPNIMKILGFDENHGLGYALHHGILASSHEYIARMDTDDISMPNRMEDQLSMMINEKLDIVGSQVFEFIDNPEKPISISNLPEDFGSILRYSRHRNPFRHPPIVYRRSKVLEAGNYSSEFPFFEDWDLFNRMLAQGCRARNLHDPLVAMRVNEGFYQRRGGLDYLSCALGFKWAQYKLGYFSFFDFLQSFVPQVVVCIMPVEVRKWFYL